MGVGRTATDNVRQAAFPALLHWQIEHVHRLPPVIQAEEATENSPSCSTSNLPADRMLDGNRRPDNDCQGSAGEDSERPRLHIYPSPECLSLCGQILRTMGDEHTSRVFGRHLRLMGDEIFFEYAVRGLVDSSNGLPNSAPPLSQAS